MKTSILKGLLSFILITMALPAQSQDFINIFFKNGDARKFYLNEIIEFKATKKDADGVQHNDYDYQYIKTLSDEYIYRIEDVESISFAKRNEVIEEQNFVNAMTSVFPIINECLDIDDIESHLDAIKTAEGVERAWTDEHQLYIEIKEGEILSFHFDHNELVDESSIEEIDSEAKALASKISGLVKPDGSHLKFAIANQQDKDESRKGQKVSYFLSLVKALTECGVDVDYIPSPSVEFFYDNSDNPSDHLNFYDYDAVILSTHGSYSEYINYDFWFGDSFGPKVHSISLSDDLFKEEYESDDIVPNWHDNYNTFKKWRKKLNLKDVTDQHISYSFNKETRNGKVYWVAHPQLSELFFRDIAPGEFKNPNSIFFNCACQSLKENDSFAEELINNHGLGVYAGYTESNYFGQLASHTLFSKMFSTLSLEKAYQDLPSYMRHETFFNINISSDFDIDDKAYYQEKGVAGAELKILPENNLSVDKLFILPVYTNFSSQENIMEEYNKSQTVKLSGTLTCLTAVKDVKLGFLYGSGSIPTQEIEATSITNIFNLGKGNYTFTAELSNLERGMTYKYRACTWDGIHYNYGEEMSFTIEQGGEVNSYTSCPDGNHPHLIDLGLPSGTKWACCNVGAQKPEDYGGYYAWGETMEKSTYNWSTYIHCDGSSSTCHDIGKDIAGTQYDAATANWGSSWVMPNKDQLNELVDNCTSEWTTENGINGRRFTGPNGASVFLPAAGGFYDAEVSDAGYGGYYWSSTLDESGTNYAWNFRYRSDYVGTYHNTRFNGRTVRPVVSEAPVYPELQLSQTQLNIVKGSSSTVEITAGSGEYGLTNLNSSIAKATLQGTTITISAVAEGEAKVVATDMQTGQQIIIEITVTDKQGAPTTGQAPANAEAVDLGLPSGTKWANMNVGATAPEEYGLYFAWGETQGYTSDTSDGHSFNWANYKWCNGSQSTMTKYNTKSDYGTVDNKTTLDPEDDAAYMNWGSSWRMPTWVEIDELRDNTTSEWTTLNGVKGMKITSKTNGNSIFLPAAGYRNGTYVRYQGEEGLYWSSSLDSDYPQGADDMDFNSSGVSMLNNYRRVGYSVRAVQ